LKILLIDLDSRIPNLALKKIERYYLDRKHEVIWDMPLAKAIADKVYVSCVFEPDQETTKGKKILRELHRWEGIADIGGTGYSLDINLPPEIDSVKPRINYGFTTRGCIRKCKYCVVPRKEGKIRVEGDLLDLWDGKATQVTVMDNNILALPEHFALVCQQARDNKITIDFNQGLDHRLLTPEIVDIMKTIRHHEYRMAFDNPIFMPTVDKAITLLQSKGIKRISWYVLVGFDTTPQEDLLRVNYLKERNQNCYVQRYKTCYKKPFYIALARWCNQHHIFQGMTWEQFLQKPENKQYIRDTEIIGSIT